MATLWLEKLADEPAGFPDLPSSLANHLVPIDDAAITTSYAFELGFDFAMGVAAAVVADPLGDPTGAIKATIEAVQRQVGHAKEEAAQEAARLADTCPTCGGRKSA